MWGEQKARQMLADAGFATIEVKQRDGDVFNNYYIATTSAGAQPREEEQRHA